MKRHSVLVVDDDANVRALYVDALESTGHQVAIAIDGADALDRLRSGSHPCVVLTDLRMPRMDGFELSSAVAHDPQLSSIPIVVVTGDHIAALTSPARDKPFSAVEIDALVQHSCRFHRAADDAERSA